MHQSILTGRDGLRKVSIPKTPQGLRAFRAKHRLPLKVIAAAYSVKGCSPEFISQVLNNSTPFSAETLERVRQAFARVLLVPLDGESTSAL